MSGADGLPPDQLLRQAVAAHRGGRIREAAQLYERLLRLVPKQPQVLALYAELKLTAGEPEQAVALLMRAAAAAPQNANLRQSLGHLLQDLGRLPAAVQSFRQALRLQPGNAELHSDLGSALKAQGKLAEALASFRQAVATKPELAELHLNLGGALKLAGDLPAARACYEAALQRNPGLKQAHNNLGLLLLDQGDVAAAVEYLQQALRIDPDYGEALLNLSLAELARRRLDAAEAHCRRAIALNPAAAAGHYNLAQVLKARGRFTDEATSLREAIRLDPGFALAHGNLGAALLDAGRADQAEASLRQALALDPSATATHILLAHTLRDLGRLDEAARAAEEAIRRAPPAERAAALASLAQVRLQQGLAEAATSLLQDAVREPGVDPDIYRTYLASLLYQRGDAPQDRYERRRHFASFARAATAAPFANVPDPGRRLRLGYLSSDLRRHPVGRHLAPLLAGYDRRCFEVFCYAEVRQPDAETARLQGLVDGWRSSLGLTDAELAAQIRADGIDILVICAGHFDHNRPLVAQHRAAPVQVSLFDGASSGLPEMDYLLADRRMCPRDGSELYAERVIGLPRFYSHPPLEAAPPVGPLPMLRHGAVTFGCFNNPAKLSGETVRLWAAVLQAVPRSRLLLKYKSTYLGKATAKHFTSEFSAAGIGPERLELTASPYALADHLAAYDRVDIALDPLPFNGSTATFEALWMGVPVLALQGDTMMSRWGATMLRRLGRPELVAKTEAGFVTVAAGLAADPDRLAGLRQSLRQELAGSGLCDRPERLVRYIERGYRAMWRRWCATSARTCGPG